MKKPFRRRRSTPAIALLLPWLWPAAPGCVTSAQFEVEMNSLRRELRDAQAELLDSRRRVLTLESKLAEAADTSAAANRGVLARMDEIERDRLLELSRALEAQGGRLSALAENLDALSQLPPMQALGALERGLADLTAQVDANERLSHGNRENLVELTRAVERHEVEFNRQMKLLAQYVQEQFVPLATGLVKHMYDESRRLSASAQELEDLGRKVDPFKFSHLQPGFNSEQPAKPAPADRDD